MQVQPYDPCPCGSEKKFKFCCQKVAKYAERAEQLFQKEQHAAALQVVKDGLSAHPDNEWLRLIQLNVLVSMHDHEGSEELVRWFLERQPGHAQALTARMQHQLMHGQVADAVMTSQQIIDGAVDPATAMAILQMVGLTLSQLNLVFSSLAHLRVLEALVELEESPSSSLEAQMEMPWLREQWLMMPAADGAAYGERMSNAIALAAQGRWARAEAILRSITDEDPNSAAAWFNLGLCQGWLCQDEAAANSLERYARLESNADAAVHALALAQLLHPRESAQTVDVERNRYPILDHSRLVQRLKEHRRFAPRQSQQYEDESDGVQDRYYLLDRELPLASDESGDSAMAVAELGIVGKELEVIIVDPQPDDERRRAVVEAAGDAIGDSTDRSNFAKIPLSRYRLQTMSVASPSASRLGPRRIREMSNRRNSFQTWPETPSGWLDNRTPREVAHKDEWRQYLRAAILLMEASADRQGLVVDYDELRRELGVQPEPWLDGDRDLDTVHLADLQRVRTESLTFDQLYELFKRAAYFKMLSAIERLGAALVCHRASHEKFDHTWVFKELIGASVRRSDKVACERLLAEARQFDQEIGLGDRLTWRVSEFSILILLGSIAEWGPRLGQTLTDAQAEPEAMKELLHVLIGVGLVQVTQAPDQSGKALLDLRMVEEIVRRFGAGAGSLDLSPVGGQPGKIWTPSDRTGSGSPIVLPGQEAANPQRSKLLIPGT